jgi:hypothetical protein
LRAGDIVQQNGVMQQRALRTVMLVHAIEESDRAGEALSMTDREHATREAAGGGPLPGSARDGAALGGDSERFLARRAEGLLARLRVRSPGIDRILEVSGSALGLDRATLLLAFLAGVALAFADGDRIDIFAYPLIGLVIWNLIVYAVLVGRLFRPPQRGSRVRGAFGRLYARRVRARIDALIAHSTGFNAPLAPGLRRFAANWSEVGQPLFRCRARRLLHLAAILVAVGLMAGYDFRGWILRESAGWSTTIFGPTSAHAALTGLYGPASAVSGVALPSADAIRALIWTGPTAGGGPAGQWIYLIDWTALLYIVFPRLLAVAVSTGGLWRESARLRVPEPVTGDYLRETLAQRPAPPGPPTHPDSPPPATPSEPTEI